jgi:hypothetical protein
MGIFRRKRKAGDFESQLILEAVARIGDGGPDVSIDLPSAAAYLGISVGEMSALLTSGAIKSQNLGFGPTVSVSELKAYQDRG